VKLKYSLTILPCASLHLDLILYITLLPGTMHWPGSVWHANKSVFVPAVVLEKLKQHDENGIAVKFVSFGKLISL